MEVNATEWSVQIAVVVLINTNMSVSAVPQSCTPTEPELARIVPVGFSSVATAPPRSTPAAATASTAEYPTNHESFLRLALLPDDALAVVLGFLPLAIDVAEVNRVCRSWLLAGNRAQLWRSVGEQFEVNMPTSLGRSRPSGDGSSGGRRMLRRVAGSAVVGVLFRQPEFCSSS